MVLLTSSGVHPYQREINPTMHNSCHPVKISIVVPFNNREDCLGNAVGSLQRQTLQDIEIICVDDGSTDGSPALVENLARQDPRIRIVTLPVTSGTSIARKSGAMVACGEYTMFLDADDELYDQACERLYAKVRACGADVVQFGADVVGVGELAESTMKKFRRILATDLGPCTGARILERFDENLHDVYHVVWNKIYKTGLVKQVFSRIEDGYFVAGEDMYFLVILFDLAQSYDCTKAKYYRYLVGLGSIRGGVATLDDFRWKCNRAACCQATERYLLGEVRRLFPDGFDAGAETADGGSADGETAESRRARLYLRINDRLYNNRITLTWNQIPWEQGVADLDRYFEVFLEAWGTMRCFQLFARQRRHARALFSLDYRIGSALLAFPRRLRRRAGAVWYWARGIDPNAPADGQSGGEKPEPARDQETANP